MQTHTLRFTARQIIQSLYYSVIIIIIASCAAPIPLPKDKSIEKKKLVPFKVGNIKLNDVRLDSLDKDMKLPPVLTKSEKRVMYPVISEQLQQELFDVIRQGSYADGPTADVTIFVQEANCTVDGGVTDLKGSVYFKATIEAHVPDVGIYWTTKGAMEYRFFTAQSVRESDLWECFRITGRNMVYRGLDEFERMETEVR